MYPYQMIAGGKFTLTTALIASGVEVQLQGQGPSPDFIVAKSITGWGEASDAQSIEWWWEKSMGQATAKGILQSSAAANAPALTSAFLSSSGISCYDTLNPPTFAALANTGVTAIAGTFVVSMASTGSIAVGDYVRLYNQTGMQQVAGYVFQVTAVTSNVSITLGYMASSGMTFAADATAGFVKKIIPKRMYPRELLVANMTKASQMKIYFTQKNDYTAGENISIRVPSSVWGMVEADKKVARVLSVTNSATESSITLDLDSTGYTTFAFPTSAQAAAGVSPAVVVPSSSGVVPDSADTSLVQQPPGTNLLDAFDNRNSRVIFFGPGLWNVASFASDNSDVWMWQAFKYDLYNGQ